MAEISAGWGSGPKTTDLRFRTPGEALISMSQRIALYLSPEDMKLWREKEEPLYKAFLEKHQWIKNVSIRRSKPTSEAKQKEVRLVVKGEQTEGYIIIKWDKHKNKSYYFTVMVK